MGDTHRIYSPAGSCSLLSVEDAKCSAKLTGHSHNDFICCVALFAGWSFRGLGPVRGMDWFYHFGVVDIDNSPGGQPKVPTGQSIGMIVHFAEHRIGGSPHLPRSKEVMGQPFDCESRQMAMEACYDIAR